jgi:hypothetical protein
MSQVLISWKEECDAIHMEMDRLLTAGRLQTAEERQVRKIQFMALIERRNVAAQNCLKSPGGTPRFAISRRMLPEPPRVVAHVDPVIAADVGPEVAKVEVFQEPSQVALATDHGSQVPATDPVSEVAIASPDSPEAPSEAPPATDQGPPAPPANPMFNAANFLKVLGLK